MHLPHLGIPTATFLGDCHGDLGFMLGSAKILLGESP